MGTLYSKNPETGAYNIVNDITLLRDDSSKISEPIIYDKKIQPEKDIREALREPILVDALARFLDIIRRYDTKEVMEITNKIRKEVK